MSKSRKSLKSRLFCGLTSAALVVSNALPSGLIGASAAEEPIDLGTFKLATANSLGSANSYAVLSKTYNQDNHMEGVFATEKFYSSGQGFGTTNNVKNYINLGENYIYIGSFGNSSDLKNIWAYIDQDNQGGDREAVEGVHEGINNVDNDFKWKMILPDNIIFDYSYNNGTGVTLRDPDSEASSGSFNNKDRLATELYHISETTYNIDFDGALNALDKFSEAASKKDTTEDDFTKVDISGDVITITCSQGPNYISLTSDQIATHEIIIEGKSDVPDGEEILDNNNSSVNLKDYSLVINVKDVPVSPDVLGDATAGVLYNKKITVDGQSGGYSPQGGQIMFNLYGVTSQVTFQECNTGVILAPKGGVTVTASHNGSIFAHDVANIGCEIHQNPFRAAAAPSNNSSNGFIDDTSKPATTDSEIEKPEITIGDITISKQAVGGGKEITGAHLTLTDSKGTKIADWVSGSTAKKIAGSDLKVGEEYTLTETGAPNGYTYADRITFEIDEDGNVLRDGEIVDDRIIKMIDEAIGSVQISKNDINGTAEISGAKLTVYLKNDVSITTEGGHATVKPKTGKSYIETWISGTDPLVHLIDVTKLVAGEDYVLVEETAPNGYTVAEYIEFKINKDGSVTSDALESGVIRMKDQPIDNIEISKVAAGGGSEIEGAKLTLTDSNGDKVVDDWTSKEGETHTINGNKLKVGEEYTLTETGAPNGYTYADSITFTIDEKGNVLRDGKIVNNRTIKMIDEAIGDIEISKVAVGAGSEIEGAKLTITDSENNKVDSWESKKGTSHKVSGNKFKVGETYTLTEETAPNGYTIAESITFEIDKNGNVLVDGNKVDDRTILMVDGLENIKISKTDINGTSEITGAALAVYLKDDIDGEITVDEEGKATVNLKDGKEAIDTWTSGTAVHELDGSKLLAGKTYVLVEEGAPDGYAYAEYIEFTMNVDGSISRNDNAPVENRTIVMKDEAIINNPSIYISKVAAGAGSELKGAHLVLTDSEGNVVDDWTSGTTPHPIEGSKLKVGETYTLTETGAPNGYTYADSITFEIDEDGNVLRDGKIVDDRTIKMIDEAIGDIDISKVAAGGGEEIEGAHLVLTDSKGNVVDEWTSGTITHPIEGSKLKVGEEYTLTETGAPNGYAYTDSITFEIDEDGSVLRDGKKVDDRTIEMIDEAIGDIEISKVAAGGGEELQGAHLVLTDSKGNVVDEWNSGTIPHSIEGSKLKAGEIYTLTETGAPNGYAYAESITFTIDKDGNVLDEDGEKVDTRKIKMIDGLIKTVQISKYDINGTNEISGATLTIHLKDDTTPIETWVSGNVNDGGHPHIIDVRNLIAGETYVLVEEGAPQGYAYTEQIEFTINEDGTVSSAALAGGVIKMKDKAIEEVKISKTAVGGGDELDGAKLAVYLKSDIDGDITVDEDGKATVTLKDGKEAIDTWTSGTAVHEISGSKFIAGETYVLVEEGAPNGYAYAEYIEFTIEKDGTVTVDGIEVNDRTVLMEDKLKDTEDDDSSSEASSSSVQDSSPVASSSEANSSSAQDSSSETTSSEIDSSSSAQDSSSETTSSEADSSSAQDSSSETTSSETDSSSSAQDSSSETSSSEADSSSAQDSSSETTSSETDSSSSVQDSSSETSSSEADSSSSGDVGGDETDSSSKEDSSSETSSSEADSSSSGDVGGDETDSSSKEDSSSETTSSEADSSSAQDSSSETSSSEAENSSSSDTSSGSGVGGNVTDDSSSNSSSGGTSGGNITDSSSNANSSTGSSSQSGTGTGSTASGGAAGGAQTANPDTGSAVSAATALLFGASLFVIAKKKKNED